VVKSSRNNGSYKFIVINHAHFSMFNNVGSNGDNELGGLGNKEISLAEV
jgi:hypothetical protein